MVLSLYIKNSTIQGVQILSARAIRDVYFAGSGYFPYIKIVVGISDRSHMPVGLLPKLL
jgi:hypothetical protein